MNKIYSLLLIIIISGCNSSRNASIESLIESGDLEELKKRKKEYVDAMNTMKVELNEINNGISLLDENERLTLVSKYEIQQTIFILIRHYKTISRSSRNMQFGKNKLDIII